VVIWCLRESVRNFKEDFINMSTLEHHTPLEPRRPFGPEPDYLVIQDRVIRIDNDPVYRRRRAVTAAVVGLLATVGAYKAGEAGFNTVREMLDDDTPACLVEGAPTMGIVPDFGDTISAMAIRLSDGSGHADEITDFMIAANGGSTLIQGSGFEPIVPDCPSDLGLNYDRLYQGS
jgi:hypothetical protein